ncbi:putative nuclear cohesin complex subunit [Phaeomoniella chlamydospora]|uniref:Putative nuclear cohesin complex subunit n=1 Tax=Phaeomoniella chlamydospora TaxID=158046 RepID=A0A0G2EYP2_PHACM|nr:putative nuclear cohesin complex subunit [Phaeomoniella chlamydospora]
MATTATPSTPLEESNANRRKSGRQIRKPQIFAEEDHFGSVVTNGSAKRKRASRVSENDDDVDEDLSETSEEEDEDQDEPDEEELRAQRRAAKAKKAPTKKPASKKAKVANGTGTSLAIRTTNSAAQKGTKLQKARARPSQMHEEGLYAEIFGRDQTGEDAAAQWLAQYEKHNIHAMTDMVNMLLKCTGCNLKVDTHDIEDVDNVPTKLGDLQDEYQAANITDYPLISKAKQYAAFRTVLVDFFSALIKTMHATSVLHEDHALFENIQLWVDTMSSAGIRPFRHTATVISLTISSALCEVARDLSTHSARSRSQLEAEKKKKSVNKGRVATMKETIEKTESRLEFVGSLLKDEFDLVFVHRYRDVDPKIRVECVSALGNWIMTYRKMFLEGTYLRYFGWLLSDTVSQTRQEVVSQLRKMFKDPQKISSLRAFAERFRGRLVEMATRDAEPGVRASTIELLELLRVAELLEPDDIDSIGQLIYDSEPRVRKAVAKFFVANINDLFQAQIDEVGDELVGEQLPDSTDDFQKPTQSWIKFKCLAQTLKSYAGDDSDDAGDEKNHNILLGTSLDSRYVLATQAIFQHMPELSEWENLAGYILYDHSQIEDDDQVAMLYKLDEGEETVLLEILDNAVKLHLLQLTEAQPEKKGRKRQADKNELLEKQEKTAHDLTQIIPQLLSKYGAVPEAASAILRLEHLLNMDLLSDLQQSTTTYTALLDDINKQFMSHSDKSVLAEASIALLNAKKYEQSKEATENKVQEMWDDTVERLQKLLQKQNVEARGTLPIKVLHELSNTVSRLASLAAVSNCIDVLETKPTARKQKGASGQSPLQLLLALSKRGTADDDTTEDFAQAEDDLTSSVLRTILFYFMWKVQSLKSAIQSGDISTITSNFFDSLISYRNDFIGNLFSVVSSRPPTDPTRLLAISTTLDLFTLISTLRNIAPPNSSQSPGAVITSARSLVIEVPPQLQPLIAKSHDALEKHFAKLSRRTLESASTTVAPTAPAPEEEDLNAPPIDPDEPPASDPDSDSDLDEPSQNFSSKEARIQASLFAEKSLCDLTGKIVLAFLARVLDSSPQSPLKGNYRQRLLRNRTKLGQNYKEVLAYLEDPKEKVGKVSGLGGKRTNGVNNTAGTEPAVTAGADAVPGNLGATQKGNVPQQQQKKKSHKSEALIVEDDDIEDDEEEEQIEEDGEEDLRRRGLLNNEDEDEVENEGANEIENQSANEDEDEDDVMGD